MIDLIIRNYTGHFAGNIIRQLKSCKPFIKNEKAILIHRPINIGVHKTSFGYHMSIHYACGLMACGSKKFSFLDNVSENDVVCARCEEMAVHKYGYDTSTKINGSHVHIGGLKLHKSCGCKS
jgi:hypothetical protein